MRRCVLGLDCSGETYSVGLFDGANLADEISGYGPRRALRELPQAVADLLQRHHLTHGHLSAVGVTQGPGSFTGVRLGITLARTIALVSGCKLIGLDTLAVLAQPDQVTAVALDARRGEVYCALFASQDVLIETDVRAPEDFARLLGQSKQSPSVLVGAGFSVYPDLIPPNYSGVLLATREQAAPSGLEVARRAFRLAPSQKGLGHDLEPCYFRRADIQVSRQ